MKSLHFLCSVFFAFVMYLNIKAQDNSTLIIFVQPFEDISNHFEKEALNKIKTYAAERNIKIQLVDASIGAPEEITFTPQLVFQNNLGRSIYRGRYLTLERLQNFIRTVQNAPQKTALNPKRNFALLKKGRANIGSPIKLTELQGAIPSNFDSKEFANETKESIRNGFNQFEIQTQINLSANNRLFYQDYHPYVTEDGKLYVSVSVFSMFSCIEPVFKSKKPWVGEWTDRQKLFQTIGSGVEQIILSQFKNLEYGDAFEVINTKTPIHSWEELGLMLPKRSTTTIPSSFSNHSLSNHWKFRSALADGSPLIQFHFGAPVDHYAGEVKQIRANLSLTNKQSLKGAKGHIIVNTSSITMGDEGLDDHIFNDYLNVSNFPNATYEFEIIDAPEQWELNASQNVKLEGKFKMLGKSVSISSSGRIEVISKENKDIALKVHGNFILPLNRLFGINGPDGPSPAKDELQFYLNFILQPTEDFALIDSNLYEANIPNRQQTIKNDTIHKDYIHWKAANKLYHAKGSFEDWKVAYFQIDKKKVESLEVELKIEMASIKERSKLLVKHLKGKDFLHVANYPEATIIIKNPKKGTNGNYTAEGETTLHGITKVIPVEFRVTSFAPFMVVGNAVINRNEFEIGTSNKSKGISEEIQIDFALTHN